MPVLVGSGHAGAMITLRGGTVGRRFTLLYAAVFLASGAGLLLLTFLLSGTKVTTQAPDDGPAVGDAQDRIRLLQEQLGEAQSQQNRQLLVGSAIALLVMAAVSLLLGRAMASRVLRPLRQITAATRRISADSLDQRLAMTGPADEVRDLADTIDGLLARLEAAFTAQRTFAANASHELRTPLATIRAAADVAAAKPGAPPQTIALAARTRTELDRVDALLGGLLTMARTQRVASAESIEIEDLVARSLDALDVPRGAVEVPAATVVGDAVLIARLIDNLVANAVRHNVDNGWIRIAADTGGDGMVRFSVQNGGPVLDQHDVDRLAQPFVRLGADRTGSENGTGLGLSIVDAIAAAHGGRLDLTARPDGGLTATVTLPGGPA